MALAFFERAAAGRALADSAGSEPGPAVHDVVVDAMRNGWYENAYHYVETFQKEFAAYHGRKYGIMTPNCTTAIQSAINAAQSACRVTSFNTHRQRKIRSSRLSVRMRW